MEQHRAGSDRGISGLVDHRSWREVLLDSEASLRLVDTALTEFSFARLGGILPGILKAEPLKGDPAASMAGKRQTPTGR